MKETLHLLVVDDEEGMRLAVARALKSLVIHVEEADDEVGFRVTGAETGEKGLEVIDNDPPHLILLDYKLPGISGIDVLNAIAQRKCDAPVVMITAYASLETAVQATKLGAFDFLAKPFTPDELKGVVCKTAKHVLVQRQARKLAQEKRQLRFQLISVVAHELKSPIAAIEGYLHVLKDPEMSKDEGVLNKSVERSLVRLEGMRKLILDLLDLTRIESGRTVRNLQQVDLCAVARTSIETSQPAAAAKRVSIDIDAPEKLDMMADASELEIILNNLISNAVKYNRDNGKVDIAIAPDGIGAKITVADTGIGMTAQEKDRLFGEFVRIKNRKTQNIMGSGLGLSIVKKLAALYGGAVEVSSEPDVGTTFTVTLFAPSIAPEHEPTSTVEAAGQLT